MEGFETEGSVLKDVINSVHNTDLSIIMVGHTSPYKVKKELTFLKISLLCIASSYSPSCQNKYQAIKYRILNWTQIS